MTWTRTKETKEVQLDGDLFLVTRLHTRHLSFRPNTLQNHFSLPTMVDVQIIDSIQLGSGAPSSWANRQPWMKQEIPDSMWANQRAGDAGNGNKRKDPSPQLQPAPKRQRRHIPSRASYFDAVLNALQLFVQRHHVYVYSSSGDCNIRARVLSFRRNWLKSDEKTTKSALCIDVHPPPEIQKLFDLYPQLFTMNGVQYYERFNMSLARFMHIVMSMFRSPQKRFYDDVRCSIEWNGGSPVFDLPLSQWIPTRILFNEASPSLLKAYSSHVYRLYKDPGEIAIFRSNRFYETFTVPLGSSALVPVGPVENIIDVEVVQEPSNMPNGNIKEIVPEWIRAPENQMSEENAPIDEVSKSKTEKKRGTKRKLLLASHRILRRRVLKRVN